MAKGWHSKHISTKWGIAILGFFLVSTVILVLFINKSQTINSYARYYDDLTASTNKNPAGYSCHSIERKNLGVGCAKNLVCFSDTDYFSGNGGCRRADDKGCYERYQSINTDYIGPSYIKKIWRYNSRTKQRIYLGEYKRTTAYAGVCAKNPF